jgi:hypothetical protein
MTPEWFDVAQTAYWILSIMAGGGVVYGLMGYAKGVLESREDTPDNVIDIRTARSRELARSQAHGIDVVIRSGMDRGFGGR